MASILVCCTATHAAAEGFRHRSCSCWFVVAFLCYAVLSVCISLSLVWVVFCFTVLKKVCVVEGGGGPQKRTAELQVPDSKHARNCRGVILYSVCRCMIYRSKGSCRSARDTHDYSNILVVLYLRMLLWWVCGHFVCCFLFFVVVVFCVFVMFVMLMCSRERLLTWRVLNLTCCCCCGVLLFRPISKIDGQTGRRCCWLQCAAYW